MPTVKQLRDFLRDYKSKNCPAVSKLKKARLLTLAKEFGYVEEVKPKPKRETQKQIREEDVARIVDRVNITKGMLNHQTNMKNITPAKLSARKEANKVLSFKRKFFRDFQKIYPKIIKRAVKNHNDRITTAINVIRDHGEILRKKREELKTKREEFSKKAKQPVRRKEILDELEENVQYYKSNIESNKKNLKTNSKKMTEAQMKVKPWKEIMKHAADPNSGFGMAMMGSLYGKLGTSSNPRMQAQYPDGLMFPVIDGVNITPYYHLSDKSMKQFLSEKW